MFKNLILSFFLVLGLATAANATDIPSNNGTTVPANVVCDGHTDISAALNAQILALSKTTGGTVVLPPGVCETGSTIVLQIGTYLKGAGRYQTFLTALSTLGNADPVVESQGFESGAMSGVAPYMFGLEDMTIDGNKANRSSSTAAVVAFNGYDNTLKNITVQDGEGACIYQTNDGGSATFYQLIPHATVGIENTWQQVDAWACNGDGIDYYGPSDGRLFEINTFLNVGYGLLISNNDSDGTNVNDTYLDNIHSWGNGNWGIYVGGIVGFNQVQSETNEGSCSDILGQDVCPGQSPSGGGGILITGNGQVRGSYVYTWENAGDGMDVDSDGSTVGTNIADFQSYDNTGNGLSIDQGTAGLTTTFTNVAINNNTGAGIYTCTNGGTNLVVTAGQITNNDGYGIQNCMYDVQFSHLQIIDNAGGGLTTASASSDFGDSFLDLNLTTNGTAGELNLGTLTLSTVQAVVYTNSDDACWTGTISSSSNYSSVNIQCAGSGTGSSVNITTGQVTGSSPSLPSTTISDVTATSGTTYTAAEMLGGVIYRTGPTSAFSDTTATAENIIAAIPGYQVGTTFNLRIVNADSEEETLTLDAGSGVTLPSSASKTISQGNWTSYSCVITSSSAITCYYTGSGLN